MSHFLPSYFAHPENILLCGFLSPWSSDYVREQSLNKILEARKKQKQSKAKNVRRFIPPYLDRFNFDAENLFDFLRWDKFKRNQNVTPPPLLSKYTDDELKEMLKAIGGGHLLTEDAQKTAKQIVDLRTVQITIGALTIHCIGDQVRPKISDTKEALIPIGFSCSRYVLSPYFQGFIKAVLIAYMWPKSL